MELRLKFPWMAIAVVAFVTLLGSPSIWSAPGVGEERVRLEDLDRIVDEAKDLNGFLAQSSQASELRERYFQALQTYYGEDKFQRASFDAIVTQLQEVNRKVPGFAKRIWETTGLGQSFKVEAAVKTTGLALKQDAWQSFLGKWKSDLATQGSAYQGLSDTELSSKINTVISHSSKAVDDFNVRLKLLDRAGQASAAKKFFNETLPSMPGLKEAKAYLMSQTLALPKNIDVFSSGDADLILSNLDDLRSGQNMAAVNGVTIPENLRSFLARTEVPSPTIPSLTVVDGKGAESEIFRALVRKGAKGNVYAIGRGGKSEYEFNTLPRRIHGIWKGVPLGECVGGNCNTLQSLTPERWATIALKDSQLYHVERSGSYLGFVQYVPLQHDGKTYASIDFGAPILRNKIGVRGSDGSLQTRPFYELALEKTMEHKPPAWTGFVVGQSNAIGNAGVVPEVRSSGAYALGERISTPAKEFQHLDSMGKALAEVIPRQSLAANYGGNMIADALVPDAGQLTVLNTKAYALEAKLRTNPNEFESVLAKLSLPDQIKWLRYLRRKPTQDPLRKSFGAFLKVSDNQQRLLTAIAAGSPSDRLELLKAVNELGGDRRLISATATRIAKASGTIFEEKLALIKWMSTDDQLRKSLERFLRNGENQKKILDGILQTPSQYRGDVFELVGSFGGDRRRLALAGTKIVQDVNTPLEEKITTLKWMAKGDRLNPTVSAAARLVPSLVQSIPADQEITDDFYKLFGHEYGIPVTRKLQDALDRRPGQNQILFSDGSTLKPDGHTAVHQMEEFIRIEKIRNTLQNKRGDLIAGLASESYIRSNYSRWALVLAPDELLPNADEFKSLSKKTQSEMINIFANLREQSAKSESLLRLASELPDVEVRVLALAGRLKASPFKPTAAEFARADADFANALAAGKLDLFYNLDHGVGYDIMTENYPRSKGAFFAAAKTDERTASILARFLRDAFDSSKADDSFMEAILDSASRFPAVAKQLSEREGKHIFNPNQMSSGSFYSYGEEEKARHVRRLKVLGEKWPDLYSQMREAAVKYWDEKSITQAFGVSCAESFRRLRP